MTNSAVRVFGALASATGRLRGGFGGRCAHWPAEVAADALSSEDATRPTTKPRLDYGPYDPAGITELLVEPEFFQRPTGDKE